jgi:uncharacterized glyoxalase superfamily protein PhnB
MRRITNPTGSRLVPALRYRDVAGAVDWLCGAFGFERQDIVTAVDGTILHARLTFGNDMILLLPVRTPDGGRTPEEAGSEMQSCYFVVDDADVHYQHAKAAGAEILDITEYDYGGRGYSCRDPEGHLWNFGTFDPRQGQQLAVIEQHWPKQPPYWQTMVADLRLKTIAGIRSLSDKITPPVVVAAVVAAVIAAATVGWLLVALPQTTSGGADKRLTFRSVTPPPPRTEETAAAPQAAPFRAPVNTLSVRPVVPQPQAEDFERAVRQQTLPAATGPSRVKSAAFAAVGAESGEDASKEAAERNAEEALRQLRAAQRTAGEAFRQLREASAEPGSAEPRKQQQVARTVPDARELQGAREQLAREQAAREQQQQAARERAAKEQALALQEQMARERAAKEASERISAVSPAKEQPRPPQEQKSTDSFWDCQPSPETGQVVCNPKKAPAAPAAAAPAPKPKVTAAEPTKAPAPAARQEQKADTRLWDCQPKPPTGEIVCRPMAGTAPAKQ